ncbi:MAG: Pr6Pr family membrane protein [Propionibacteriaceae bacterium]
MTRSQLGRVWHVVTFGVAVTALVIQLVVIVSGQTVLGSSGSVGLGEQVRRYFAYFTIQSNLLVAVTVFMIIRRRTGSRFFRVVRLASLIGITVTGVVAFVALPPSPDYSTVNLICDRLLHIVVPLLTLVGWIVVGPRGKVFSADILPALAWPIVWLAATLALGPVTKWYPYPFLDVPALGLGRVLVACLVVAVLFVLLAVLACWSDRRLPGSVGTAADSADAREPS